MKRNSEETLPSLYTHQMSANSNGILSLFLNIIWSLLLECEGFKTISDEHCREISSVKSPHNIDFSQSDMTLNICHVT